MRGFLLLCWRKGCFVWPHICGPPASALCVLSLQVCTNKPIYKRRLEVHNHLYLIVLVEVNTRTKFKAEKQIPYLQEPQSHLAKTHGTKRSLTGLHSYSECNPSSIGAKKC